MFKIFKKTTVQIMVGSEYIKIKVSKKMKAEKLEKLIEKKITESHNRQFSETFSCAVDIQ